MKKNIKFYLPYLLAFLLDVTKFIIIGFASKVSMFEAFKATLVWYFTGLILVGIWGMLRKHLNFRYLLEVSYFSIILINSLMVHFFTNIPIYIVLPVSLVFGAGSYWYQFKINMIERIKKYSYRCF